MAKQEKMQPIETEHNSALDRVYAGLRKRAPYPMSGQGLNRPGETWDIEVQTNIVRGQLLIDLLRSKGQNSFRDRQPIAVNIIGVGYRRNLQSAYVPARLAAQLEGLGLSYTLTLTDVRESVLKAVQMQRTVQVPPSIFSAEKTDRTAENCWKEYLRQVGCTYQEGALPHSAPLPSGLIARLESGEVSFVYDDVRTLQSCPEEHCDIIICENVLIYNTYFLADSLAILNMIRALRIGGWLCVRDNPRDVEYLEWFQDTDSQRELGIKVLITEGASAMIVQKVKPFPSRFELQPILDAMQAHDPKEFVTPKVLSGTR